MLVSLCDVLLRWLLEFVTLRAQSRELMELEIIVRNVPSSSRAEMTLASHHAARQYYARAAVLLRHAAYHGAEKTWLGYGLLSGRCTRLKPKFVA